MSDSTSSISRDQLFSSSELKNKKDADAETIKIVDIDLNQIRPSPYQPRRRKIGRSDIGELMASIDAVGQLQPIVVSPSPEGHFYVHAGERRCVALRLLGRTHVRAIVRDLDDREARKLALSENLGREDLSGVEQAEALATYASDYGVAFNLAAQELGISDSTRKRLSVIAAAPNELREAMLAQGTSPRVAELIAKIERAQSGLGLRRFRAFVEGKTTTAKLERELREVKSPATPKTEDSASVAMCDIDERGRIDLRIRLSTLSMTDAEIQATVSVIAKCLREMGVESVHASAA